MALPKLENEGQGPLYEFLRLSNLRANKGLSKSELARLAKVAPNTLAAAEKRVGNKYELYENFQCSQPERVLQW